MYSRYGELLVAVRDQEERVRFLGYDPANVKVVAFAVAALFAGIAGHCSCRSSASSPRGHRVVPSIAFLIGVAIGGRSTLLGPVLGAIAVAWAQTSLSEQFPSGWTYAQGLLFIVVVGFSRPVWPGSSPRSGRGDSRRIGANGFRSARTRTDWSPGMTKDTTVSTTAHLLPDGEKDPRLGGNAGMSSDYLRCAGSASTSAGSKPSATSTSRSSRAISGSSSGPTGRGKTTIIDAITGLVPSTGSIQKSGVELVGKKVHQIARLVWAGPSRPPAFSKNSRCCRTSTSRPVRDGRSARRCARRPAEVPAAIEEALETTGLAHLRDKPAGVLAHGQKQWLEIGMLLVQNASVLLLDEPVAGMSGEEREQTATCCAASAANAPSSWSSTIWSSCAASRPPSRCWPAARYRRGHRRRGAGEPEGAGGLPRHHGG